MAGEFLRPELRAWLRRWREPLALAGLALLGLWGLLAGGLLAAGGALLVAVAALAAWPAVQRARRLHPGDGPGIVRVDEGRVAYLGPHGGGVIALDSLTVLRVSGDPATWLLEGPDGRLEVPTDALGADRLLDAFAALPGLAPTAPLAALDRGPGVHEVWRRPRALR